MRRKRGWWVIVRLLRALRDGTGWDGIGRGGGEGGRVLDGSGGEGEEGTKGGYFERIGHGNCE